MLTQTASVFATAMLGPVLGLLILSLLALFLERKLIGIAQKRLGISFLGRNGWAHLPADLVKFWLKQTSRHHGGWNTPAAGVAGVLLGYLTWSLACCFFFASDAGASLVDFWDFQLLAYFSYANLSSLFMYTIVIGSKSKYATIAAARLLLVAIAMEVFFAISFLLIYAHSGGYAFDDLLAASSRGTNLVAALPPLGCLLFLYVLFEAKRAPFDHTEAESELVAGHMVEFGGRALLFFYMCEYAHLCFGLFLLLVLVFGGTPIVAFLGAWPFWADIVVNGVLGV